MPHPLVPFSGPLRRGEDRRYLMRRHRSKFAAAQAARKRNAPVLNKLRGKPKRASRPSAKNASALVTLSRQVKNLQMSQFGSKQYQAQAVTVAASYGSTLVNPLGFCANCFYEGTGSSSGGTKIYQGAVNSVSKEPTVASIAQFDKQTYDTDLDNQYQWNEFNNVNTVSLVEYMPVYAKYTIKISGTKQHDTLPVRYRITAFKIKSPILNSNIKSFTSMPDNLGAYWRMCDDTVTKRNYFSSRLHKIVADKFITIRPFPGVTADNLVYVRKCSINLSFDKLLKPNLVAQADVPNPTFWTNVPIEDQVWIVISSNNEANNGAIISVTRQLCWRDRHGVSTA